NIYAPNDDNPNFFKNVLSHLLSFECEDIILGGDFNLVLDVQNDKKGGRLTTHKNSLKENQLTLTNICAPNNDDSNFFTSVFSHLADFKCDEIIIGGDFNLVLDVEKDKKGGLARTHKK
ncbi:unnamed protein product, partial [Porites evermanni]